MVRSADDRRGPFAVWRRALERRSDQPYTLCRWFWPRLRAIEALDIHIPGFHLCPSSGVQRGSRTQQPPRRSHATGPDGDTSSKDLFRFACLVFSEDSHNSAPKKSEEMFDLLGATTVGVTSVARGLAGKEEVVPLRIPVGTPTPDRAHLLPQIYRSGGWLTEDGRVQMNRELAVPHRDESLRKFSTEHISRPQALQGFEQSNTPA